MVTTIQEPSLQPYLPTGAVVPPIIRYSNVALVCPALGVGSGVRVGVQCEEGTVVISMARRVATRIADHLDMVDLDLDDRLQLPLSLDVLTLTGRGTMEVKGKLKGRWSTRCDCGWIADKLYPQC